MYAGEEDDEKLGARIEGKANVSKEGGIPFKFLPVRKLVGGGAVRRRGAPEQRAGWWVESQMLVGIGLRRAGGGDGVGGVRWR